MVVKFLIVSVLLFTCFMFGSFHYFIFWFIIIFTGIRQEQDIYVRLIDSVTKQVRKQQIFTHYYHHHHHSLRTFQFDTKIVEPHWQEHIHRSVQLSGPVQVDTALILFVIKKLKIFFFYNNKDVRRRMVWNKKGGGGVNWNAVFPSKSN